MSVSNNRPNVAYGISDALLKTPGFPIISKRAPLTTDKAPIGQVWIFTTSNLVYILTSIVANSATWILVEAGGGTGVFASLEATTGNITADLGNIVASQGSISAHTTVTAGTSIGAGTTITAVGDISSTGGGIDAHTSVSALTTVTAGSSISAGTSVTAGSVLVAAGDSPGANNQVTISGSTLTTQGVGNLTILSPTGTSHANTGLIKAYAGNPAVAVYIPYFADIS
jgi:hypothetical protein